MSLSKAELKRQLQQLGIKVEGNYIRKKTLANSTSDFTKEIPDKSYAALSSIRQQYEMLCHTLGAIRHHVETEESPSAEWIKTSIDDLAKRVKAIQS